MIPSALAGQLQTGLADFLRASFASTTPGFQGAVDRLVDEGGAVMKGPYVQVFLPFVPGARADWFPKVPLGFTPHRHQERAFERLGREEKLGTLVATGTGSGKTESFLWPILDHCQQHAGEPGIKAILIYPMNALAGDQALRLARAIATNPHLAGKVTAGLYVGEDDGSGRAAHTGMGEDHVITDRATLQKKPPDILLTNYKMLDYLLVRPKDRHLWAGSGSGSLRFLVVDELHTFDGAQGTDLACLIRRLKHRLQVRPRQLACVGTSATLGGDPQGLLLREYAARVFGEAFGEGSVITEQRVDLDTFRGDSVIEHFHAPDAAHGPLLDPSQHSDKDRWLAEQVRLWFGGDLAGTPGTRAWKVALGEALRRHVMLDNLLRKLRSGPRTVADLRAELFNASPSLRAAPAVGELALLSFLALISEARAWRAELPAARAAREREGKERPVEPFLQVRLQVWQREMARMVASVEPTPMLRFSDDLTDAQRKTHLPAVHCRECGAMGWAALVQRHQTHNLRTDSKPFYTAFFGGDVRVRFLFPLEATRHAGRMVRVGIPHRLLQGALTTRPLDDEPARPDELDVVMFHQERKDAQGRTWLSRECPFCGYPESLSLVGFRAATLTSVYIDQLFASPFNDDKKLLIFSDSVQDAAHRAGFFGARTWRFNLRIALQRVVSEVGEGLTLRELPGAFVAWWRGPGGLDELAFLSTFLAPNLTWFRDWDTLCKTGELPPGSRLLRDVERRITWEIGTEYGLQARIGRSLPRTRSSAVAVDAPRLERAVEALLEPLRNEVGGLRSLTADTLRVFLAGLLQHIQEKGGILLPDLPGAYVSSGGETFPFSWKFRAANGLGWLPDYGKRSRLPELYTDRPGGERFEPLLSGVLSKPSWAERWYVATLGTTAPLVGEAGQALPRVMQALVDAAVLDARDGRDGAWVWGLRPDALRVTKHVAAARCARCGYTTAIAVSQASIWRDAPCLSGRCTGRCGVEDGPTDDYFGRLYASGQVARIFADEHTGLLGRAAREEVESRFKSRAPKPWYPNLLSCTPTLEMGIDIGDLSSTALCSVPPAQANYLQRIGRAGRRDGNAFVLTIANAKDHDNYFYAKPEEMIAGHIEPPGVYLDASAVLERQLTAFCFDRWACSGVEDDALPRRMRDVYVRLAAADPAFFPHNLGKFISENTGALLQGFREMFPTELQPDTWAHLQTFLHGPAGDDAGLMWRILEAIAEEARLAESLRGRRARVRMLIRRKKKEPQDESTVRLIEELEQEADAVTALIERLDERDVLNFFTDEGLLPNYAFPEAPVRLRSVIWRRKDPPEAGKSAYETWSYEYDRPGATALSELAPENVFYAGGRQVRVDQVDVESSEIERWRFCNACSFAERLGVQETRPACPSCGSALWPDPGQVHPVVKLKQVFANTSDRESRIKDDSDNRRPRFYSKQLLVSFRDEDRGAAWQIDDERLPFAFEFVSRATFRDLNFGEQTEEGVKVSLGGREAVRGGFKVCRFCGKVQDDPETPKHTLACQAREEDFEGTFVETVWLYRSFDSEAVRMLLPIAEMGTERELQSFVAALQVGLRAWFGGRVDHLRTTLDSEPVPDSPVRKQYLILYDTVPGGTGYLKELLRAPDHLFQLLEKARDRLVSCACATDPARDGCYRCLFQYRQAAEMKETSRSTAVDLIGRILEHRTRLKAIRSLGEVSVKGLLDSVLEARFIEALRRMDTPKRRSEVGKAIVRGKPGYRWTVAGRTWLVEPQHNIGPTEGLGIGVSVDFMLHPGAGVRDMGPVAVFLDGWQWHRDRIAKDLLQRMSLLASGRADVWSFSWRDIDEAFERGKATASANLAFPRPDLLGRAGAAGPLIPGALRSRLQDPTLSWFIATMAGEVTGLDWLRLAWRGLFTQMAPVAGAAWGDDLTSVPAAARTWITAAMKAEPVGLQVLRSPGCPWSMYAVTTAAALKADFLNVDRGVVTGLRLVTLLHDDEEGDAIALRDTWAASLRAMNLLRVIPRAWFLATSGAGLDYTGLMALREAPRDEQEDGWSKVRADVVAELRPLVRSAGISRLPLPEVGVDLPDARGHTSGVQAELAWPAQRVAVVLDEDAEDASRDVASGWTVLRCSSADLPSLQAALQGTP